MKIKNSFSGKTGRATDPTFSLRPETNFRYTRYILYPLYAIALGLRLVITLIGLAVTLILPVSAKPAKKVRQKPAKTNRIKVKIESIKTQKSEVVPIAICGVLAIVIGIQLIFFLQPQEEVVIIPEVITQTIDLELPVNFNGCKENNCVSLPYYQLGIYQQKLLDVLERTQSQKTLVNLALTYYYQNDITSYEQYMNLAQEMDPSEALR